MPDLLTQLDACPCCHGWPHEPNDPDLCAGCADRCGADCCHPVQIGAEMPDPTDAEIQAGADAIARSWRVLSPSSRRHLAKLVLVAVLPDHDARLAEEIAQAIEVSQGDRCPTCRGKPASQGWRGTRRTGRCGGGHTWQVATWPAPAAIARQHSTRKDPT